MYRRQRSPVNAYRDPCDASLPAVAVGLVAVVRDPGILQIHRQLPLHSLEH